MSKYLKDSKGRFRRSRWTPFTKAVPAWAVAVIVILMVPAVYALTISALPSEHISLYGQTTQPSQITVMNSWVSFYGPNKAVVFVEVKNTASNHQDAWVNVTLLDGSGNEIVNESQVTGSMAGGSSMGMFYYFHATNLASEYGSDFIQVREL